MNREHKLRWIAAVLGACFLFGSYYFLGHLGLILLTILISCVGYWEFLSFLELKKFPKFSSLIAGIFLSSWLNFSLPGETLALFLAIFSLVLVSMARAHQGPQEILTHEYQSLQFRTFGLVYLVFFSSFVPKIHTLPFGSSAILFLLLLIWGGDTAAYYGGKLLGKHKLSSFISPGKTWEGSIAALLFCAFLAVGFSHYGLSPIPTLTLIVISILTSAVAQLGDLVESFVKRAHSRKDSGGIIPGHGGVFDRFDSLILAAPFFYFLLVFSL
ncbi:MAG: phosphatidate cytidylyltransferase [Oligoflexia bacterium]|nr:phosphatidate cytidylyltransferase [Oligoflexia bacterium]